MFYSIWIDPKKSSTASAVNRWRYFSSFRSIHYCIKSSNVHMSGELKPKVLRTSLFVDSFPRGLNGFCTSTAKFRQRLWRWFHQRSFSDSLWLIVVFSWIHINCQQGCHLHWFIGTYAYISFLSCQITWSSDPIYPDFHVKWCLLSLITHDVIMIVYDRVATEWSKWKSLILLVFDDFTFSLFSSNHWF